MSKNQENNYAFIDSNNLYLGISNDIYKKGQKVYSGWKLDYKRFRVYLKDYYGINKAFLFIGFKSGSEILYTQLQKDGYICVFKPTLELAGGKIKGNVDAELVLHSMIEYKNYDKALIVSGDGDFYCLASYFIGENKLKKVLAPNRNNYSCLLKRLSTPENNNLDFLERMNDKLEYKKR